MSENKLEEIPESLANLKALRVLRLQNNRLKTLPYALGAVITLEELDCAGNADLDVVPAALHSDTAMILWICRLHKGLSSGGALLASARLFSVSSVYMIHATTRKRERT